MYAKRFHEFTQLTSNFITQIENQSRIQEEDEDWERKCKKHKTESINEAILSAQKMCEEKTSNSLFDMLMKRNLTMVRFLCAYFIQIGIPTYLRR